MFEKAAFFNNHSATIGQHFNSGLLSREAEIRLAPFFVYKDCVSWFWVFFPENLIKLD